MKVTDNFRDRYEFTRTHIKRETVLLQISLMCIMVVTFLLRFQGAFEFNWALSADDPYSQLIAAAAIDSQIDKVGLIGSIVKFLTFVDPIFWYPYPGIRNMGVTQHLGTPLTAVVVRRVFLLIGTNLTIEQAAFIAPAFCGSLTILVIYFLGKELANKKVGLLSAYLLAFNPGFMQRSIAGFFDNEALGNLFMLLAFYFFLRALRNGSFITSFLAGLSMAGLYQTWGGSTYAIQLIALFVVILVLLKKFSTRLLVAYTGTILPALSLAVISPSLGPQTLLDFTGGMIPLGILGMLVIISVYRQNQERINNIPFLTNRNLEYAGYGLVIGGISFLIFNFFVPVIPTFRGKFITVIVPFFRDNSPLLQSVAEHLIQSWGAMFRSLFLLVFLLPIAIIYLYRKPTENNIFFMVYLLSALYFSGSMARLIVILSPPAVLAGAKAIDEILTPYVMIRQEKFFLSKRKRSVSTSIGKEHVSVAFIVVGLVLVFNLLQGLSVDQQIIQPASIAMEYKTPNGIKSYGDWYETFDWLQRETPTSSVIASWWDYGYWLSLSNRTLVVDGATLNSTQIGNIGAMLMSSPDMALKIASYYDIDYIVVLLAAGSTQLDNDIGKVQWMVKIAEDDGNLATQLGHPILSKNFFNYASDSKSILSYDKDFFKSLIWSIMTRPEVGTSIINSFKGQQVVSSTLTTTGFAPGYAMYSQIFQQVHLSHWSFLSVTKINWDAAERLVGVPR